MDERSNTFCDLIQIVDVGKLTHMVSAVDRLHDSSAQARSIAYMLVKLRDEGDGQDRALAARLIYGYLRAWLQHRPTEEPKEHVEFE